MKLNENTNISLPIRNLVAIIGAVALGVWAYFGIEERLNKLETADTLFPVSYTHLTLPTTPYV